MKLGKIIDIIQISLFFLLGIGVVTCFALFCVAPKSNMGNIGGLFLFLAAGNALLLYDRND